MYLSRLILNPRSRQVQRELADTYQLHRTIMAAFPEKLPADERVLFRLEIHPRSGGVNLLVQSQHEPDWSRLLSLAKTDYLDSSNGEHVAGGNPAVKSVSLKFQPEQRLVFRLRANPTVKRNGKRYGLNREEEQLDWLQRKIEGAGAQVLSARISNEEKISSNVYHQGKLKRMQFLAVQFEGVLQVENPDQLLAAVGEGIGSGKGLGFGMLSLAVA
jgi:CRISPR system Cascade subunit CasE